MKDIVAALSTAGAVAAGVVIIESALLPGLAIGAAAVLVPKFLAGRPRRPKAAAGTRPSLRDLLPKAASDLVHVRMSRTVVKTITFRAIVTSLDFTGNYLVLGEPMTAAGLSAISLVGGPLFYFLHEGAWNYLVGSGKVDLANRVPLFANQPLAKTITYRTLASIIEFTTNYVVVRDLGTAALLTSFGFFLGPFVYYGHELAWERFGSQASPAPARRGNRREPVIIDVEPIPVPTPA